MKKLFFLLSFFVAIISLSSCGAQEECRPRGGYTQVIDHEDSTPVIVYNQQEAENN